MTSEAIPLESVPPKEEEFKTGQVLTIVGGHFVHDTYTAFLAPLLPLIIEKLSLSLTLAGSLNAVSQIPALLNPFIGYLADRASLRYFVILAPAVTATLMSSLGFAPNYMSLLGLLFVSGVSIAVFHAPALAMIGRISGRQVGKGMSLFMAGGELGRTVGPLLAVGGVSLWGLEGSYRLVLPGWLASLVLYLLLRQVSARPAGRGQGDLRAALPRLGRVFLPLSLISLLRGLPVVSISVYLPTLLNQQGSSLWAAGSALALVQAAGVAGALLSGSVSDRLGRKPVLLVAILGAALLMLAFLNLSGWLLIPVLLGLGFLALSTQPVLMAIVQDQFPEQRAVANGLYMSVSFLVLMAGTLLVGSLGDRFGLRQAYLWSAAASLLALPLLAWLPGRPAQPLAISSEETTHDEQR
jgi:FSR family fosmidomycin resistance protein-like MFS transporter